MSTIDELDVELRNTLIRARELARETSPITPAMVAAVPTWRAAYSDRTASLMATMCDIAYDRFEDSAAALQAMEIRLARGGFRLVGTYNVNACTQAYLAVSDQMAVMAFRGTESPEDWRVNFTASRVPISAKAGAVKVHQGFLEAFQSVQDQLRRDVDANVPPTLGLYITGHSLGGALAQIASAAFEQDNLAACYTFGSPRVGGADFDNEVRCPHYRLVNAWDLVPGVPPPFYMGYRHGGDVRTLGQMGRRPIRRNRPIVEGVFKTIAALVLYPLSRKLFIVDDHMIARYAAKLAAVVQSRRAGVTELGEPMPRMEKDEILARLQVAYMSAVRREGRSLSPDNARELGSMAKRAADRIVKEAGGAEARAVLTVQGEAAFSQLVAEMANVARELADYPPDRLGEESLIQALRRLCPLPPIC